jgi:hypothetical protein
MVEKSEQKIANRMADQTLDAHRLVREEQKRISAATGPQNDSAPRLDQAPAKPELCPSVHVTSQACRPPR